MPDLDGPLAPGGSIGILGSGQLGRMAALAAARLGYRCHAYGPDENAPANQVCDAATVAAYDDREALTRFAGAVDVVTFEFENIPLATVELLEGLVPLRPGTKVLSICQHRQREKDFCRSVSVPTADYRPANDLAGLKQAVAEIGTPCILKSAELGYDGKGQVRIEADSDLDAAWAAMRGHAAEAAGIVEALVQFRMEISVIVARGSDGTMRTYVPVENRHRDHILDETIVPANLPQDVSDRAEAIARHLAQEMALVGLLAVEMFVTHDGKVLVNEMAPRPHNSGHWSIDACITSQFEQFIRAVAGLPLGSTERLCDAVMKNLLGDEVADWRKILADPGNKLHLYGKAAPRPGRKMGHVTRLIRR
ncbi:5-(carboxyamino)imidazole ribonucleotide synthase [Pelagibius litoralis]|uniref:N5-carboxyaminoimidazole ribonucleotide synthase n=1 Tax=Pelagibius litoralis TaxID=374515 RepID=A0A967C214_9PROT|nr:5-(carboxyamino)imidazole ribonucleotide synthase [Pelagibius litoralis]NIA68476.1 5-(carboxyamino)imidazole ribonucleotide synthase [Pelagibius litoralis]